MMYATSSKKRSSNNIKKSRTRDATATAKNLELQSSSAPTAAERNKASIEAKQTHAKNGADGISETSGDTPPDKVRDNLDGQERAANNLQEGLERRDPQKVSEAIQEGKKLEATPAGIAVKESVQVVSNDLSKSLGINPDDARYKRYQDLQKASLEAYSNGNIEAGDKLKSQADQAFNDYNNNLPTSTKNKLKEAFGDNYKNVLKMIALAGAGVGLYFLAKAWSDEYDGCYKRTLGKDSVKLDCFDKSKKDYCNCDGTWDRSKPVSGQCSGNNANYPPCACGAGSNPLCSSDISADGSITYIWRDVGLAEGLGRALGDAVSNGLLNPGADVLSNFFDRLGLGSAFKYILIGIGVLIFVMFLVKFAFRMMDGGGRSRSSDFSFSFYSNS